MSAPSGPEVAAPGLSPNQTAKALRAFTTASLFWGSWGRVVGVGTAAFTGYALWLGATDAQIAYFASISSFVTLVQVVSSTLSPRIARVKAFILVAGAGEMVFRFSIVLVPALLPEAGWIRAFGLLLAVGLVFGNLLSPLYNGWLASIIPESIRGRFIGRQTNASTISGMVAGYVAGLYLDRFDGDGQYIAFVAVFAAATLLGVAGYIRISPIPFVRPQASHPSGGIFRTFRAASFRKLTLFYLVWNFGLAIAGPFYSVYMLRQLHLSYSAVALFSNIFLVTNILGYRIMGGLIDRFGSRAVLNVLVPPTAVTTAMWAFSGPDSYALVVVALALNGLLHAGIATAVGSALYAAIPEGQEKTPFFASWAVSINTAVAVAPLIGSLLVGRFEAVRVDLLGYSLGNIQLVFLISAAVMVAPVLLLRVVDDARGTSSRDLLSRIARGNILGFVYGSLLYDRTDSEEGRARAARRMGRSRSPMALSRLAEALDDASPEVRRQAVRSLGDSAAFEAVAPLLSELRDPESDLRPEAVEALGRIGDPTAFEPLLEALEDADSRVRLSAVAALSALGGEAVRDHLWRKLQEPADGLIAPALIEALSRSEDLRVVLPALSRVPTYRSSAIRLQLLNAVCRALGGESRFYHLLSRNPIERATGIDEELRRARKAIRRTPGLPPDLARALLSLIDEIHDHPEGDVAFVSRKVIQMAERLAPVHDHGPAAARRQAVAEAVRAFSAAGADHVRIEAAETFLIVCLSCLVEGP